MAIQTFRLHYSYIKIITVSCDLVPISTNGIQSLLHASRKTPAVLSEFEDSSGQKPRFVNHLTLQLCTWTFSRLLDHWNSAQAELDTTVAVFQ
jgi:hypothetical protein